MKRRLFSVLTLSALALTASLGSTAALAQERIGVLMLHGKNPGSNTDPNFSPLKSTFEREGWLVSYPDMPWSRSRYLDGNWDKAMAEMADQVKSLREKGASRIVLVGHSLGCPAALSFAARGGDVQALVLLAPGHIPKGYYTNPRLKAVHDSIEEARGLVAAGKGDTSEKFYDINQGKGQPVITTARHYLSYFDPASDAEMSVTAPRIPGSTPVMSVIGETDPMFKYVRSYYADSLPANPRNQYLEVRGGHLDTPRNAIDEVLKWIKVVTAP